MKLNLLLTLSLPAVIFAQSTVSNPTDSTYPNTFSSGSKKVQKFDNSARKFKDWAISVGGGAAFMIHSDLTSFYDGKVNWGGNAYVSLDKQISHSFGLSLQYSTGKTNQRAQLPGIYGEMAGVANAWTKYNQISLLGDVNFSNLFRRVDNHSAFRWALHGYAGIGLMGYKTLLLDNNLSQQAPNHLPIQIDQKLDIASFFYQGGLGLKYNVSKLIDLELRAMYVISGDDTFDGGGERTQPTFPESMKKQNIDPRINYNAINDATSDNMLTINLGATFKIGKNANHLAWYDPLQDIYFRTNRLQNSIKDLVVCEKGDLDNDGVCDDWDRELNTPAGARVDGAGVALDIDLDGVIDLYDKCVTVPGPVENDGCPIIPQPTLEVQTQPTVVREEAKPVKKVTPSKKASTSTKAKASKKRK